MSAPVKPAGNANQPHYSVTDKPRQLDDEDMAFIVEYTNGGQVAALREHVLRVWQRAKQEVVPISVTTFDATSSQLADASGARVSCLRPVCSCGCTSAYNSSCF